MKWARARFSYFQKEPLVQNLFTFAIYKFQFLSATLLTLTLCVISTTDCIKQPRFLRTHFQLPSTNCDHSPNFPFAKPRKFRVTKLHSDLLFVFQEYDKLSSFVSKHYRTSLDKVDLALKGWNWGTAKFKGKAPSFCEYCGVDGNFLPSWH